MSNGSNDWGVTFGRISWLGEALESHRNVLRVMRHDDVIFEVTRVKGSSLTIICLDEYALGVAVLRRIDREFSRVNFIYVGGNWNGYTPEAKERCVSRQIGLYNASEISGALWKDDFWTYVKKDDKGNPEYQYRVPRVA